VHAFIFVKLIFFLGRQVWGGRSVKIFGYLACGVLEGFFFRFLFIFFTWCETGLMMIKKKLTSRRERDSNEQLTSMEEISPLFSWDVCEIRRKKKLR
jgi:hypothetical protein